MESASESKIVGGGRHWRRNNHQERGEFKRAQRRLILASVPPLLILGSLMAVLAVPAFPVQVERLTLFIEPLEGIVEGVQGPHTVDGAITTPLDLKPHLSELSASDSLVLVVSAVARVQHGQVVFIQDHEATNANNQFFLADLIRYVNKAKSKRKLVIMDVQWPIVGLESSPIDQRSAELHRALRRIIETEADSKTRYLLTANEQTWARGMQWPRESAFSHAWNTALDDPKTDANGDGRITVDEAIGVTTTNLRNYCLEYERSVQSPTSIGPALNFEIAVVGQSIATNDSPEPYPVALTMAWQQRDDYLKSSSISVDFTFIDQWQRRLLALESRWRRGVLGDSLIDQVNTVSTWSKSFIDNQLSIARSQRPESLWRASQTWPSLYIEKSKANTATVSAEKDATDKVETDKGKTGKDANNGSSEPSTPAGPIDLDSVCAIYADRLVAIEFKAIDDPTRAAVDKLSKELLASLDDSQRLKFISELISRICDNPEPSPLFWIAVDSIAEPMKDRGQFAETLAISHAIQQPIADLNRTDTRIRLICYRSRLGIRPEAFAVMPLRLKNRLSDVLQAEKFYWYRGYTTDAEALKRITSTQTRLECGLSQQECVAQAISMLEIAFSLLHGELNLEPRGVNFVPILEACKGLAEVLFQESSVTAEDVLQITEKSIRFEKIRHATERLQAVVNQTSHQLIQSCGKSDSDPLSVLVEASQRTRIYWQLVTNQAIALDGSSFLSSVDLDSEVVSSKDLTNRFNTLFENFIAARKIGEQNLRAWTQLLLRTSATINDSDGYYYDLQNQIDLVVTDKSELKLTATWQGPPISWENQTASLVLSIANSDQQNDPVSFQILPSASSGLQFGPTAGSVVGTKPALVRCVLSIPTQMDKVVSVAGAWVEWHDKKQVRYTPIAFPLLLSRPEIELRTESPDRPDRDRERWRLWPKAKPQSIDWNLVNLSDTPIAVTVTLQHGQSPSLISAPIELLPHKATPVRFPTKPKTVDGEKESSAKVGIAEPVTITVVDSKTKRVILSRQLQPDLVDIRRCISVDSVIYRTGQSGGSNRLDMNLEITKAADPGGHQVALSLIADPTSPLRSIGGGNLLTTITREQPNVSLGARDLAINEGVSEHWQLPLIIDGDGESIWINALTPYNGSPTDWTLDNQPKVMLDCQAAAVPGDTITVFLGGRNMEPTSVMICEYGQWVDGQFIVHESQTVTSPRQSKIDIESGGANTSLTVLARRERWPVTFQTSAVAGEYTIRVRSDSDAFPVAETVLLLDDQLPTALIARTTAEAPGAVKLTLVPNPSGVAEVSTTIEGKVQAAEKVTPGDDSRWEFQFKAAESVIDVNLTTVAGKQTTVRVPVQTEVIPDLGVITGVVYEGMIAQPNLPVTIVDSKGRATQIRTDAKGKFELSIASGKLKISATKTSSGRQAEDTVVVERNKTATIKLRLLRSRK